MNLKMSYNFLDLETDECFALLFYSIIHLRHPNKNIALRGLLFNLLVNRLRQAFQ